MFVSNQAVELISKKDFMPGGGSSILSNNEVDLKKTKQ